MKIEPDASDSMPQGVLVINLDHRTDRLKVFHTATSAHPALTGWQRLRAVNGQELPGYGTSPWFSGNKRDKNWAGRAGCALSHRKAIAEARARNWDSVLILEDDIEPAPHFTERLNEALFQANQRLSRWKVLYLGVSKTLGPARRVSPLADHRELCEIFGCFGAFAYVLRAEGYDWLLSHLPTEETIRPWIARHRSIDRWYAKNLHWRFRVAALTPSLLHHYSSFSDIGQRAGAWIAASSDVGHDGQPIQTSAPTVFNACRRILKVQIRVLSYLERLRAIRKARCGF